VFSHELSINVTIVWLQKTCLGFVLELESFIHFLKRVTWIFKNTQRSHSGLEPHEDSVIIYSSSCWGELSLFRDGCVVECLMSFPKKTLIALDLLLTWAAQITRELTFQLHADDTHTHRNVTHTLRDVSETDCHMSLDQYS